MQVTDEMVERAQLAADELNVMVPERAMRAALTAALAAAHTRHAVEVKALEWRGDGDCYAFAEVTHTSYSIAFEEGKYWANWNVALPPFDTLDAAKAAAQTDYEQRIRSALVYVPAGESEPVAWLDDGTLRSGSVSTARRVVTNEQKRDMPAAIASSFTIPLYLHPPFSREGEDSAGVVEKMARAMCERDGAEWDAIDCNHTANGEEPEEQRDYWRDKAEAALAATRSVSATTSNGGQNDGN